MARSNSEYYITCPTTTRRSRI